MGALVSEWLGADWYFRAPAFAWEMEQQFRAGTGVGVNRHLFFYASVCHASPLSLDPPLPPPIYLIAIAIAIGIAMHSWSLPAVPSLAVSPGSAIVAVTYLLTGQ